MIRRVLPLLLVLATAGAAHGQRTGDRDRISSEEVRSSTATDAYQLVQSLRSIWFTRHEDRLRVAAQPVVKRDAEGLIDEVTAHPVQESSHEEVEGPEGIIVLLDNALLGGRESLREIPVNRIESVEFLSPEKARMRYDRRARDGAIVVHTLDAGHH